MSLRALNSGGHVHEEIRRKLSTKTTTSAAAPPHHHHHHGHAPPAPPSPSPSSKQLALEQQTEDASESSRGEKEEEKGRGLSRWHTILVISNLTGIAFAGSMSTGVLTIGLPRIATDLTLSQNLLLWLVSPKKKLGSPLSPPPFVFLFGERKERKRKKKEKRGDS